MDKTFWLERWQKNHIDFNQSLANPLMQKYFSKLRLNAKARIFVPLCGKSIDMLWLAAKGYQVIGVELSQIACAQFFNENNISFSTKESEGFIVFESKNITLLAGDFFQLTVGLTGKIDAVYDRAALIALPLEMRNNYSNYLSSLIPLKAQILLITTYYDQSEMQGPPFSISQQEIKQNYEHNFKLQMVYEKKFKEIPLHLKSKGLLEATEHLYFLTKTEARC